MQRGEALDDGEERAHRPGALQDEDVVLALVLHDLLNLQQQRLDERVVDGLRHQRLLQLQRQLHQPRLVGARQVLLVLQEALVLDLLAQRAQLLLQLLVLELLLAQLPPRLALGQRQALLASLSAAHCQRCARRLFLFVGGRGLLVGWFWRWVGFEGGFEVGAGEGGSLLAEHLLLS